MGAELLPRMNRVDACLHEVFILSSICEIFSYGQSMNLVLN